MVIVVGMPYANVRDPELRARMDYLTSKASAVVTAVKDAPRCITGQEYYRDLCMKTVNQSIGG